MSKVIIVGAGIAGLSAAHYARKAGHDVEVFERCLTPGGVSTSWKRKGYLFEGGIHWLVGSSPKVGQFHRHWVQTGALQENNPVIYKDPVFHYRSGNVEIPLWRDIERFTDELLRIAPEDRKAIMRLRRDVHHVRAFYTIPASLADYVRCLCHLPAFLCTQSRLLLHSTEWYVNQFSNEEVRTMLSSIVSPYQNAESLVGTLVGYHIGDNGFPEGGSLRMAWNMANRATELGCRIHYNSTVERVCVERGRVTGVLVDGAFHEADNVLVTIDTRTAIDTLFEEPIAEKWARKMRQHLESEQCMFLSLGVAADLTHYPKNLRLRLREKLTLAGMPYEVVWVNNYSHAQGYAPEGCACLTMLFPGDTYDYWTEAKKDGTYKEKKQQLVDAVVGTLEEYMPEIKGRVEVSDLATPLTYERYCQTWRGAYMGVWREKAMPPSIPYRCRTIKGLYFAGMRTFLSGGLPVALVSGYNAARAIKA